MGDPGDISQPYEHFVVLCLELAVRSNNYVYSRYLDLLIELLTGPPLESVLGLTARLFPFFRIFAKPLDEAVFVRKC